MRMRSVVAVGWTAVALQGFGGTRVPLWPEGKIPDFEPGQFAALTCESQAKGFVAAEHRMPYVEWMDPPAADRAHGGVMILVSGGGYQALCCWKLIDEWNRRFTGNGFQCVNLVYRVPRPKTGLYYRSAWQDAQRAVRLVRAEAKRRGLDPSRIGLIGMSAGGHLAMLMAASSSVPAYAPVDALDREPCSIDFAFPCAVPYGLTDSRGGIVASRGGTAIDCTLTDEFKFDAATPPVCFLQGGNDQCSPNHTTMLCREFRKRKIPCEIHLYADADHNSFWERDWWESARGFIRQMNLDRRLGPKIEIERRGITNDVPGVRYERCELWPKGKMPDRQEHQCEPWYEWWVPTNLTTKAIQIVYSGGAYLDNHPESWDGVPAARRFLNAKGMAVVVLKYRTPRPKNLAKHTTAWQDLQRCIRLVRRGAAARGLDPDLIGAMGSSAGGHLTLMGATSSRSRSYNDVDAADRLPCTLRWAVAVYPAYALTDGVDGTNARGGNDDGARLVPDFAFDPDTCPILFLHGDADGVAAMNSVKVWEQLRRMGVPGEIHTLAKQEHCFMTKASEGTGAALWLDRIWSFLAHKGFVGK